MLTFFIEIGDQVPVLGHDPELEYEKQILTDIAWLSLSDLCEADRVYVWTAGLLSIPVFAKKILSWDRNPGHSKILIHAQESCHAIIP